MTNSLLTGIRVLDLSRLLPGPFCTLYLAQMGATVLKIEDPAGGDYARALSPELFELVNRNKQSLTLDLRKPEGAAVFKKLVAEADVVLESFRPGVMDRLGCGYDTLRAINPRLVYAALTGYGQSGPYRDRAGHDMNYCGYAGALDQSGIAGGDPALSNTQLADLAGGALTCGMGILAAVLGARTSGAGTFVDAAMLDGTLALQVMALATLRTLGKPAARGSDMLTGALPNYAVYSCADGRHISVGALEPKFFKKLCHAAGRPDLAALPLAPGPAGATLRSEMQKMFRSRSRDDWEQLLGDQDACVGAILDTQESLENEQVKARALVQRQGNKPAIRMPLLFPNAEHLDPKPAPALGADTEQVLASIGISADARELLRKQGVC